MMTQGIFILTGPTACGKTELAVALAERLGAEIVGADSRQIYRGMPIGTAMPTMEQRGRVAHHLVDFLDPRERYSAARFVEDALAAADAIHAAGKRVVVVGGTGFYVRALCGDVSLSHAYDPALRARLAHEARVHPPEVLHAWLAARDPGRAREIAPSDPYRILRALEIALDAGKARDSLAPRVSLRARGGSFLKVWLEIEQEKLDERIERRTDAMLDAGFLSEAERVGTEAVAADAIGYPQALAYLRGWMTRGELRTLLIRATRRYAKRQRTWFGSEKELLRVPVAGGLRELERLARERLGWF